MEESLESSILVYLDYLTSQRGCRKYHSILKNERSNLIRKIRRRISWPGNISR